MISDDAYLAQLQTIIMSFRYWIPSIADVADVEDYEARDFWRITAKPHLKGACPFELLLRRTQRFDFDIAGEVYEDRSVPSLHFFPLLLEAVVSAQVVQRRWSSTITGALIGIETVVSLQNGQTWRDGMSLPKTQTLSDGLFYQDYAFLPYRR